MRIAILGAGGFIGSHLVQGLLADGEHELEGVDSTGEKLDEALAAIDPAAHARWTFHEADVRIAPALLRDVIRRADLVVDLIAHANPSLYVARPLDVFELNFMQNLEIARLCMEYGRYLVQYSSAEVYGKTTGAPYREDATDSTFGPVSKQRWIYASAKLLLERVLYAHGEAGDLRYTIVRPFNFLGPRIDYLVAAGATGGPRVFPHFMSALLSGGPIRLVGGGDVRRAFLHIDDATAAFRTLLAHPDRIRNEIFNVGNPDNQVTVRQFAHLMLELWEELTGESATSAIESMDGETFYGVGYEDGDREPPDVSKMRALGWAPRYGLRETVRETMRYYLAGRGQVASVQLPAGASARV